MLNTLTGEASEATEATQVALDRVSKKTAQALEVAAVKKAVPEKHKLLEH